MTPGPTESKVRILIPCYNDWDALEKLLATFVTDLTPAFVAQCTVTVVDDGSTIANPIHFSALPFSVEILTLTRNLGHQKAIAIGLSWLKENREFDFVVVMDADGEDKAISIQKLVDTCKQNGNKIVFAERTKRHEGWLFIFFYRIYRIIFYMFTGLNISFGNNCAIPVKLLAKLVHVSEIWNHFPGGVIRSKLPYMRIPLSRGKRLAGQSKMNFTALILYGLSAISVQIEQVALRVLFFTLVTAGLLSTGILVYFIAGFPGWEPLIFSALIGIGILVMLSILTSLVLVFLVLSYRSQKLFIPAKDFWDYVDEGD